MGKYESDAAELLALVGGRENIAAVSHCVTRMRFVLNDPDKANVEKIEEMKVVKGSFTQSGQFQVIIGNNVADFYNDFVAVSGLEGVSKDAVKQAAKKNQNILQRVVAALAEIFAPLIPAIITGGLILGFRNCIDSLYLFENGTKTLCEISQFWTGVDSFLWLIGEAIFHMLPVGICWSVTKKMGTTQMLGIVLGLTLVSGQLLNAYSVATTAAADIPKWDFGYFKINMIGYQAQVIPAIFGVNLKYKFPFICGMIGSACAAVVCVATSTTATAIGVGGLPGILSIQPKYLLSFAICMVIAIVIPFFLTCMVGKKKLDKTEREGKENAGEQAAVEEKNGSDDAALYAFTTGTVLPLKEVKDGVFSEGVMGEGLAIRPEEDLLYAPADAVVTVQMEESRHAVGLMLDNGMELLLHIGIDTVDMNGDGFAYLVKKGERVRKGTPLIRFDREKIKAAGHPEVIVCVVTEPGTAENIAMHTDMHAECGKTVIMEWEDRA